MGRLLGMVPPRLYPLLLFVLCCLLYANTLRNGYVYDDRSLYTENEYVQAGWSGIPKILSTDAYNSLYRSADMENRLQAGRYRPLSMVTFAAEVGTVGQHAWLSHLINVLLYGVVVVLLYRLLLVRLFPGDAGLCLVIGLIFALHPVHTEVVANVKSRDELLSLLFMVLTCGAAFRSLPRCALWFVLALLSKEYAVTLLVLIPLLGVLDPAKPRMRSTLLVLGAVLAGYLAWRFHVVGLSAGENTSLLNNPFAHATVLGALATKLLVLWKYLLLLVWPHPLAYDYSFAQIPYATLGDVRVWGAVVIHVLAAGGLLIAWRRGSPLAFGLMFYGATLGLISNLVVNSATMMGERLLFHPSVGFAMLLGWGGMRLARSGYAMPVGLVAMLAAGMAAGKVVTRNLDWKDEIALYTRDVRAVPNSGLACCNAGAKYMDLFYQDRESEDLEQASIFTERALAIDSRDMTAQVNLGLIRLEQGRLEDAQTEWAKSRALDPTHPMQLQADRWLADALRNRTVPE